MTWELIHTSAPRGLHSAHGGFVTVAETAGLPRALREVLESLSAFDLTPNAEARQGGRGALHGHSIVHLAGRAYSVLSRIVPCGSDHTGRPNRLAHHVVLGADERPAAGPAAALADFPAFLDRWDGPPEERPFGPIVAARPRVPAPCATWERLVGDAGWAGELLRAAFEAARATVAVVLPRGFDTPALADEMVALVPAARRWELTFCDRDGRARPDVESRLRLVDVGAIDLGELRRRPGTLIIEVAGSAPDSAFSRAAREGASIEAALDESARMPGEPVEPLPASAPARSDRAAAARERILVPARSPAPAPPAATAERRVAPAAPSASASAPHRRRAYSARWVIGAAAVAVAALLAAIVATATPVIRDAFRPERVALDPSESLDPGAQAR
ncbi:MAG TPA: hypothetical protein PKC43_00415 [Phycisphaerales bacterium]|nr:hypothetical protein [Phycisphaerales bacterium]HMP35888.1 hypothetical protein [Phycisphaerales bacterium]